MANPTNAALLFGILVFLQVSCAVSLPDHTPSSGKFLAVNVPAVMTVNGFQEGEGGGGPAACDGQYHSNDELVVSLSSVWFDGGARCGKRIVIMDNANLVFATVVDECSDCNHEVGSSAHVWHNLNLDPSVGEANIHWSDVN